MLVTCPSGCGEGSVWGTDVYTDDSTVCRALLHAGTIPASGGKAAITFVRGQLSYVGTQRNGVNSSSYGKWGRSFYAQALDDQGRAIGAPPTIYDDTAGVVGCTDANPFPVKAGDVYTAVCTSDCTNETASVWGSNPYTGDSALCMAARHAGALKPGSLKVKVTFGGPKESFKGSAANGVKSNDYGHLGSSMTLSKAD